MSATGRRKRILSRSLGSGVVALALFGSTMLATCSRGQPEEAITGPLLEEPLYQEGAPFPEQPDSITSTTPAFHFVWTSRRVPEGATVEYRLIAVDSGGILAPDAVVLTRTAPVSRPDLWVVFSFRTGTHWPPGPWRAEVVHGGVPLLGVDFEIAGEAPPPLELVDAPDPITTETTALNVRWSHPFSVEGRLLRFRLVAEQVDTLVSAETQLHEVTHDPSGHFDSGFLSFQESLGFPPGRYRIEALDDQRVFGTLQFEVVGEPLRLVSGPSLSQVLGAVEAPDTIRTDTERFFVSWSCPFHESARHFEGRLIALEVQGMQPNHEISRQNTSLSGTVPANTLEFLRPDDHWQPGRYRVEVARDGVTIGFVDFSIESASQAPLP